MRRTLDWAGRSLITAGSLVLLFVLYQLWGTGIVQSWEQRSLQREFRATVEQSRAAPPVVASALRSADSPTTTTVPPEAGEGIGLIRIPAIGVDQALVEGAEKDQLDKGPGHYPHSPMPGHAGNASIAGHRTTHGAPFNRLDELDVGDEIVVTTSEGTFTYVVDGQVITDPSDVSVVLDQGDNRLTLTTCNPKYSARERLIVFSHLRGEAIGEPESARPPPTALADEELARSAGDAAIGSLDASPTGLAAAGWGTLLWTAVVAAAGAGWWWIFRRRRHVVTWIAGGIPFLLALFFFFGEVDRLLPSNF
jgi:sortase A